MFPLAARHLVHRAIPVLLNDAEAAVPCSHHGSSPGMALAALLAAGAARVSVEAEEDWCTESNHSPKALGSHTRASSAASVGLLALKARR